MEVFGGHGFGYIWSSNSDQYPAGGLGVQQSLWMTITIYANL